MPVTDRRATVTLEPGAHSVVVRRGSDAPAPIHVTLAAGKPTVVVIGLRGERVDRPAPRGPAQAPPRTVGARDLTPGALVVGAGAALVAGCAVALAVAGPPSPASRRRAQAACARGRAPTPWRRPPAARAMLPLAIATGAAGCTGLGAGTWLLLRPSADHAGRATGLSASIGGTF
ncbi:MAG: hypothetical protein IPF92_22760 [Myxococcales bacterium]|nr:hypothetical protein [Myxococcales bacterium]